MCRSHVALLYVVANTTGTRHGIERLTQARERSFAAGRVRKFCDDYLHSHTNDIWDHDCRPTTGPRQAGNVRVATEWVKRQVGTGASWLMSA